MLWIERLFCNCQETPLIICGGVCDVVMIVDVGGEELGDQWKDIHVAISFLYDCDIDIPLQNVTQYLHAFAYIELVESACFIEGIK